MSEQFSEFITDTLPAFAAVPAWRDLFDALGKINEDARKTLLAMPLPKDLKENLRASQVEAITAFMRANLDDSRLPRMMVRLIDWESGRQKVC